MATGPIIIIGTGGMFPGPKGHTMADRVSRVAGIVLRKARNERALTLRDVESLTSGTFKPSALGAYERGERGLTVSRFCALAALYEFPADQLLAEVTKVIGAGTTEHVVIDLNRSPEPATARLGLAPPVG